MYEKAKLLMPDFPRTEHLSIEPNTSSGDKVASQENTALFLLGHMGRVNVEEKMDGSNLGIALVDGQPMARNRSHVLNKAYPARNTPAHQQYTRVWTWLYENADKLRELEKAVGSGVTVYGEWLFATHTIQYDELPDLFVSYDVWHQEARAFLDPTLTLNLLMDCGFSYAPLLGGRLSRIDPHLLMSYRDRRSRLSSSVMTEGIYLKAGDGEFCTARYKMVAPWFKSDDGWNKKPLTKNTVLRTA